MAATGSGGGEKVELHDGFIGAVARTVENHASTASTGAAGTDPPLMPEGVDPISAEIVARMSGWGGERLLTMGNVGKTGAHLGAAAGATAAGLTGADVENAATISAADDV